MTEGPKPDHQKTAAIESRMRKAQEKFLEWKPSVTGPIIPDAVLWFLVPPKLLAAVHNLDSVALSVVTNNEADTRFLLLEHTGSPITNKDSLSKFKRDMSSYRRSLSTGVPLQQPEITDDVDEMHLQLPQDIADGNITLNDRVLLETYFSRVTPTHMHVTSYIDRTDLRHRGIATDFYRRLEAVAKKVGCQFMTSENYENNITFYTEKLGRTKLFDLPLGKQGMLLYNLRFEPKDKFENVTVAKL